MKRIAESQLTKDNGENEDESQEMGTGFQKADPSALSARKMRSLPRRSLASAASPAALPSPPVDPSDGSAGESSEPASRFGAFAGFGGSGAAPSAFTFTPPASQPTNASSISSSAPTGLSFSPTSTPSATKPLSMFSTPSNPTPPSTPPLSSEFQRKHNAALQYYMSLRGLNSSFLDAVTKAVQMDPFVDIAELLEKYKSFRLSAQKEFDSGSSASGSDQNTKPSAPPPPQASPSKPPLSMPAPPKAFFGFGAAPNSTGPSLPPGGGFTPKEGPSATENPPSPFAWSGKPLENTAKKSNNPFALGPSSSKPSSGGFSFTFGKSDSTTSPTPFGTVSPAVEANKPGTGFANSKSTGASDSIFENKVKSPEKVTVPAFSFKTTTPAAPLTPGFSSFLGPSKPSGPTGESSTLPPAKLGLPSPSPPSPSGFGFGTSKNLGGSSPFGSFGKGSIGNPVGFAFGSPPTTPSVVESSNPPAAFGSTPAADVGAGADSGTTDRSLSVPSNTAHDPSPAPSQGSAYDEDGPGEEHERTLHETRAKAYKMSTGEKKGWVSVGIGQMKLKAHVDVAKRRILMRNSSTGHVILNFNLFPGFQITVEKKTISFRVPGDNETAAVYQLKVPSEVDAINWQETIQKEVDALVDALVPSDDT